MSDNKKPAIGAAESTLVEARLDNQDWNFIIQNLQPACTAIRNHDIVALHRSAELLLLNAKALANTLQPSSWPAVAGHDDPDRCEKRSPVEKRQCKYHKDHTGDCLFLL